VKVCARSYAIQIRRILPPKADILRCGRDWRLFDHLVGSRNQDRWQVNTERFGGFVVDDELKLCRLLNRQLSWSGAFDDFVDVSSRLFVHLQISKR